MSTARRRISIHDYPEHLNPFSENHLTFQDKRKILADKLRKNGTWSSKISKRLSRSVSWLEKSWLTAEDSQKKNCSNQICDKVHEPMYRRPDVNNICLQRPRSYLDIRHHDDNLPNRTQIAKKFDENQAPKAQNNSKLEAIKPEPKRRKKRPAPLPPIADIKCDSNENAEISLETCQIEDDDKIQQQITPAIDAKTTNAHSNSSAGDDDVVTKTCRPNSVPGPSAADHEVDGASSCENSDGHSRVPSTSEKCCDLTPSNVTHESHSDQAKGDESRAQPRHVPPSISTPPPTPHENQPNTETTVTADTSATVGDSTTYDHNQNIAIVPLQQPQQESQPKNRVVSTQSPHLPPAGEQQSIAMDENANVATAEEKCVPAVSKSDDDGASTHHRSNGSAIMV